MKTAMKELVEDIIKEFYRHTFKEGAFDKFLEKEKEQITNIYWDAYNEGKLNSNRTAEEYYNQKYNQQDDGNSNTNV
jgi:hypothetical protein